MKRSPNGSRWVLPLTLLSIVIAIKIIVSFVEPWLRRLDPTQALLRWVSLGLVVGAIVTFLILVLWARRYRLASNPRDPQR